MAISPIVLMKLYYAPHSTVSIGRRCKGDIEYELASGTMLWDFGNYDYKILDLEKDDFNY